MCVDPVFGEVTHVRGAWSGTIPFGPIGQAVQVDIHSEGPVPADAARLLFSELASRWSALQRDLADALFALWSPHLQHWSGDHPPLITSRDSILRYVTLDYIELTQDGRIILGCGFTDEVGWDDAMLSVEVREWRVSPRSLDD
jgi:hypothetical protein